MTSTSANESAVLFTERAARKARQLLAESGGGQGSMLLRVYIQGGGCSGFQYGFDLESSAEPDDLVVEKDGVKLLIDPLSFPYLMGGTIDWKEDLQGARFTVSNPNASATCGCGQSFTI